MIGIVSGAGPLAGLDVARKIIEETRGETDQDHLPVLLFSLPAQIPDRTGYLMGHVQENPGGPIADLFIRLERAGASVAAIACNSAHSAPIFDLVKEKLNTANSHLQIINLIEITLKALIENFLPKTKIAVLSTLGTKQQQLYSRPLAQQGFEVVEQDTEWHNKVHQAIYDPVYGIKAQSSPVSKQAVLELQKAMDELIEQGAQAILLGCTELPLAFSQKEYRGIPLLDPNRILARKLIEAYAPDKLK